MNFIKIVHFLLLFGLSAGFTSPSSYAFDHTHKLFGSVLQSSVRKADSQGLATRVHYKKLKKNPAPLNQYLDQLSSVTPSQYEAFSREEKMAFLINAYNAFTLKLIVQHYPVQSIKDIGGLFSSPWKNRFFMLFQKQTHLDDIEHGLLRKDEAFRDPRIHFAVNCASIGCPALSPTPFTAKNLEKQLEEAGKLFLSDFTRNSYTPASKELKLSKIFDWYGSDFKWKYDDLYEYVSTRITKDEKHQKLIEQQKVDTTFNDYNWSLNDWNYE